MTFQQNLRRKARQLLRKISRRIDPPHPDQALGNVTYAQHGEDIVVLSIFQTIGIPRPRYLDIGAHSPFYISNTALLYERGARGVNVEANPHLIGAFHELRPEDINLNLAVGDTPGQLTFYLIDDYSGRNTCDRATAEEFVRKYPEFSIRSQQPVEVATVRDIYQRYISPADIDLLTIDVEGLDQIVVESMFNDKIYPKVLVIEVVSGGDNDNAQAIRNLLEANGYFIFVRLNANYIAVRNEFKQQLI